MDEALAEFKALKNRVDKFEKNLKKCSQTNRTKGYLEGRLKGINEIWKSVCEADVTVNSYKDASNENEKYFEDDHFGSLEEKYFQLVGQVNEQLLAFQPQPRVNPNVNNNQNQQQNDQSKVKLPKISLPSFSGSYHNWLSFKNRFSILIHDSKSLSNVEKLEYLKSCVTDKAERTIQRYQITDQNYALAWKQLNDKYDNQRILQVTQVETIIDRRVINAESAKEIRELIDITQECLESLKNLGVDVSTWDIMLVVLITRKLPFRTRELWEEELQPTEVPTYQQLGEFLEKRYRTLESLELIGKSDTERQGEPQFQTQNRSSYTQPKYQRFNCIVCNTEPHLLTKCEEFLDMSVSSRNAVVNSKNICENCLGTNHTVSDCRNQKRCFKCGNKHHTLIHQEIANSSTQNSSSSIHSNQIQSYSNQSNQNRVSSHDTQYPSNRVQSQTYVTNQANRNTQPTQNSHQRNQIPQDNQQIQHHQSTQDNSANPGNHSYNRRALTTTSRSTPFLSATSPINDHRSEQTLFPTAIIKVKSAGGTIYSLRALLDQCSDEAYIKESVAKMLGLKLASIPAFEVTGLGDAVTSTVGKATKFEMIVQLTESMEVEANVVKNLIEILPKTNVAWPKNLFENIQLADPTFATPGNIDVMLGGQQYAELILDGMLKKNGYLAQNTKLGWIISGKSNGSEQNQRKSFCGFTHTRRSYENCSDVIDMKYPRKQRIQGSDQKANQSRRYYPIYRSTNHSISRIPLSDTVNQSDQINTNQSKIRVVIGSSHKQKINSEKKRMDLKVVDQKPIISKELLSVKQEDNHNHFVPSRPSLIDFNINRLCTSNQISRIVKNFAQRWRSESLLATTSIMRPIHIDKQLVDTTPK